MKFKIQNLTKSLLPAVVKSGGAIAATIVADKIPVGSSKVKNAIVAGLGLFAAASRKGTKTNVLADLGEGAVIGSMLNLAQDFKIAGAQFTDVDSYEMDLPVEGAQFTDVYTGGEYEDGEY